MDYPNIWGYLRDLYQTRGFGDTTDMYLIDRGYQVGISLSFVVEKGRMVKLFFLKKLCERKLLVYSNVAVVSKQWEMGRASIPKPIYS